MPRPNNKNHKKKFTPPPAPSLTPTWRIELPLDDPCQIYPRVSTPEQKKNVSAEMQKDKSFAISCGWREDLIILDDRDLGVSGQILMEDREAFNDMLRRIAKGKIKAVVVVNVDRLFRDKWGAESGKFMEICHTYGVIIVTPDFVYDFRISWHIERFKRRCEEAWNYLEYHIYGCVLPAKDRRGYAGYWTGHSVPMGYLVDIQEKIGNSFNPRYHRYVIHEPHAAIVRWIFRRFKELHGNVNLLLTEIRKKGCLFPDFDETVDPDVLYCAYNKRSKVEGGHTIVTREGLRSIFKNRIYIGQWVYKGQVMELGIENYPPAIVDIDDFTYAYNRLSKTKLDGTPSEDAIAIGEKYARKHFADRPAILKEVISAADPGTLIYTRDRETAKGVHSYYFFMPIDPKHSHYKNTMTYTIGASGLDAVVLERLREHMQEPDAELTYQDYTEVQDEVVLEASETLKDIERDMQATKALIARIKAQVESGKLTDPELAEAANNSYMAAKQDLVRLELRKEDTAKIADEDKERKTYKELMQRVEDLWEEDLPDDEKIIRPEDHPRLVYLFVKSVILDPISPGFFTATIEWKDPAWGIDCGVCYRGMTANLHWTEEEKAILQEHILATRKELLELLPRRSYQSIRGFIQNNRSTIGIEERLHREKTTDKDVPFYVCLEDWHIMRQYGITEAEIRHWGRAKLVYWY